MASVHPTALVDRQAELDDDVEVGPYAIVGPRVRIGGGSSIGAHTVVSGRTTIGRNNRVFPHAAIGGVPQDKKYAGEDTALAIGDGNTIREFCTINIGTAQGGGLTRIGADNWIMAYVHVAHDCRVGDHCILANAVTLAGHVELGDWVILGGLAAVHQFCRVGSHAMAGGGTILVQDLPPFVICNGNPAAAHGLNSEGLKRRGFSAESIAALRRAYKTVYKEGLTAAAASEHLLQAAAQAADAAAELRLLADFVRTSKRGIVR
ncbi:MAG: acyl-ACP--UDP-N-acetylglucosamine O-acyltransferase [Burkholderiales bacterium]|jgi:UDP-N-acetylglucosamine acyltransferase|nr:acyl-ACP--UDP-N-acetylglucosamine O-acyltransferase [Burkholderiales bacterium]